MCGWLINERSRHFLFQLPVFWNCQNGGVRSKMRMFGYLGYRGYFFSDFYKSDFLIFTYSEIRKLGLQKIRNFQTSFRHSPTVKYKNLSSKIRDFNTNTHLDLSRYLSIVKYESLDNKKSEIFRHPSFRYSPIDFQTSIFSIFVYSQIRKLGFQKSENFKHPSFQSIFAYIQIRKLRSHKSVISKRPAEHPAFLIFVNIKIQKLRSFRK